MPSRVEGMPGAATRVLDWLGFRYLVLRQFAEHPGKLEMTMVASDTASEASPLEAAPSA